MFLSRHGSSHSTNISRTTRRVELLWQTVPEAGESEWLRSVSSRATSRIPLTCDHPRWDHDNSRTHTWDLGPPGTSWDPLGLGRNPPGLRPSTRMPPSCCTSGCIHPIPFGHQRRGNPHPSKVGLTGRSHDSRCKVLRCLLQ